MTPTLVTDQWNTFREFVDRSLKRWSDEFDDAATDPNYKVQSLFATTYRQYLDNVDTWSRMLLLSLDVGLPTITIQAPTKSLKNRVGSTSVRIDMAGLQKKDFVKSALEQYGGTHQFADGDYEVEALTSARLQVKLTKNAPVRGIYRGLVMAMQSGAATATPLALVIVRAT